MSIRSFSLALLILPVVAFAVPRGGDMGGVVVGNGGTDIAYEFTNYARLAISEAGNSLSECGDAQLEKILAKAKIVVTSAPLYVGEGEMRQQVVAKNYRATDFILVNDARWRAIESSAKRKAIVLHEILGLAGLEGTGDYHLSQRYYAMLEKPATGTDPMVKSLVYHDAPDARVTIIAYIDLQCPFSSRGMKTMDQLIANYDGKIKLVVRNIPLPFHEQAQNAAIAGVCAAQQGRFPEMVKGIYADYDQNQQARNADVFVNIAKAIGLDIAKFKSCMKSPEAARRVNADWVAGEELMVTGTPSFFFTSQHSTKKMAGAYPLKDMTAAVEEVLKND